jgi:DNA-binding beta-propeller fold protein YncE
MGSTVGGYRLDALIARGGMGVVYRATQLALDRPVALKLIARHLASDEAFRDRFLRESQLAARLDHPGVVPVYDAREEDGELLVAMRLVQGGDLKKRISSGGPLPPEQAVELLGQVAGALDAAHEAGIVHRDVKPHNVLLEGEHRAFLSDFGLASVLYESLTGLVPYARQAGEEEPLMPAGLDRVIERAVARDPADRFQSAGELIEAAREMQGATPAATAVLSDSPERPTIGMESTQGPRRAWLLIPAAAAAAVVAALLLLLGGGGVSVSAPVPVGRGPLRIATGAGAVWVTSAADGTLTRIDPETLRRSGPALRLGAGISGVAAGGGSVWVSSPGTGRVLRIDPQSGDVLARIDVPGRPGAILFAGGRVWVADDAGSGVTAINPGGRVVRRGIAPHAAPLRLAAGAGAVWASSASTGSVRRIDLDSLSAGDPIRVGRGPAGVTVGGGFVWVANSRSATVSRVDPSIQALIGAPIPVEGRPGGVDAGTKVVWVANVSDGTLIRLDLQSGEPVGDPIGVGPEPGAVTVGGRAVWVANNGDGTITRVEP